MHVTIRLFAGHRERVGTSSLAIDLPDGSTAEEVFIALSREHPALADTLSFTTFARNRTVVTPDTALRDGDELALLQPVSGG